VKGGLWWKMTVTYIQHVHTAGKVGAFLRLLTIWRGSVFAGIWRDLLLYSALYGSISLVYRLGLAQDEALKQSFEKMCVYLDRGGDYIPLSFILGFYVTQVVNRWWLQFTTIPWSDRLAFALTSYLPGTGRAAALRRRIIRLASVSNILALRRMSTGIARRFPSYQHLQEAGLLTNSELARLEKVVQGSEEEYQVTWLPVKWALTIVRRSREDGLVCGDLPFTKLEERLEDLACKNRDLLLYGWVNIPLVYTQLVTIAVNVYFLVALFGRQLLSPTKFLGEKGSYYPVASDTASSVNLVGYDDTKIDVYIPFFLILQFIFYFGWLKVAEILINPFGDDDDDFDCNHIVDSNYERSRAIVTSEEQDEEDEVDEEEGQLPDSLPHTLESYRHQEAPVVLPTDGLMVGDGIVLQPQGASRRASVMSCHSSWGRRGSELTSREVKKAEGRKVSLPRLIIGGTKEPGDLEHLTAPAEMRDSGFGLLAKER